jgi:hypothetical protein
MVLQRPIECTPFYGHMPNLFARTPGTISDKIQLRRPEED